MFCGGGGGPNLRRGGPNPLADMDRGVQIRGGFKSAVTPVELTNNVLLTLRNIFQIKKYYY